MPETGIEPAHPLGHTDLNRARLPIPPPGQINQNSKNDLKQAWNLIKSRRQIARNNLGER